jgi:hypothetical protein
MRISSALALLALAGLCLLRRHDLATAAGAVPPQALAALAALHLASLVARSEAWRLSLAALAGTPPSRAVIHAANAGAFVAGALEAHAALPARVALLRRLAPHQVPHPTHVAVADMPILMLEAAWRACGWCWPSRTSTPPRPRRRSPSPRSASSACCPWGLRRRPARCCWSAEGPGPAPWPPAWR